MRWNTEVNHDKKRRSAIRTVLFFAAVTVAFCCCRNVPVTPDGNQYMLANDFPYARQISYVTQDGKPFSRKLDSMEQKNEPGSISFAMRLYREPVLTYSVKVGRDTRSDLDLQLTVESEYPQKLVKHFKPSLNQINSQDLAEFSDRPVLITFSAGKSNVDGFYGLVTWINPAIKQVRRPSLKMNNDEILAFRNRHKNSNVLIVAFDAARASHVGAYGYPKPTTPVIDSIASDGVIWKNAVSPAVSTRPSTSTLFTGVMPDIHKVFTKRKTLPKGFRTMAECFQKLGYQTALFAANPNASEVAGLGRGFHHTWNLRKGDSVFAQEVVKYVNPWLDQVKGQPFFSYIHFREPHEPFDPPDAILARFTSVHDFVLPDFEKYVVPDEKDIQKVITAYDANLASADEQFGTIVQRLKKTGLYDKTIIIIIADHGEAFWEHGKQGHNSQVYEETIRIPMIMRFPNSPELKGLKLEQLVGSVDLFPTLVDLFQISRDQIVLSGESLLPFLVGGRKELERVLVTETSTQNPMGLRSSEFKYLHYPSNPEKDEFYHLPSDPQEKRNVIYEYPAQAAYFRTLLLKRLDENKIVLSRLNLTPEGPAVIDKETEEELKALGYVN